MELAIPFVVAAAAHPSLDDAVRRFHDHLRVEARSFGARRAVSPPPGASLVRRLDRPGPGIALAAMVDGEVIGLARIDESATDGPELLIAVATPWRRRGVATALGRATVARAHAAGVPRIVMPAGRRCARVHELGAELGFRVFDLGAGRLDLVRSSEPAVRSA